MNKFDISIERNGRKYVGVAKVEDKTLTVTSISFGAGSKSSSSSANNEFLAKLLLNELIDDYERSRQ